MKTRGLVFGAGALTIILAAIFFAASTVQSAALTTVTGKVFFDGNADGFLAPGEAGARGVTVRLYRDANGNGFVDRNEAVVATTTSDDLGDYRLPIHEPGYFVARVDAGSFPHGERLTTSSQYAFFVPPGRNAGVPTVTGRPARAPARDDSTVSQPARDELPPIHFGHITQDYVEGQVIVGFHPDISHNALDAALADTLAQHVGASAQPAGLAPQVIREIPALKAFVLQTTAAGADALLASLTTAPAVRYVERNYLAAGAYAPNDPDYADLTKSYGLRKIGAERAWDVIKGSAAVTVAVVDSGLAMTHPEFAGRIVPGWDFVNADADPSDDQGHGTHVTGIIAAAMDNNQGMTGVAPEVSIMPVKVLNATNTGAWADIAAGIVYAADHGAQIINLSLGGPVDDTILLDAVQYAAARGVLIVAAAGNVPDGGPFYPASYAETIAVGATTSTDVRWTSCNYGDYMDVAAPGASIWSAYWTVSNPITYTVKSGTSMAAAHVSGLAALVLSANPALGAADLRQIIQQTAYDLGTTGWDPLYGAGRIDAEAALGGAGSWVPATRTPAPTTTLTPTASPTATPTPTATSTPSPTASPTATPPFTRRANAGSVTFTDSLGQVWAADQSYTTGGWGYTGGSAKSATTAVSGTVDDLLFQKYREGMTDYRFTIPNGIYQVTLRFAEFAASKAGARVMKITLNGVVVETGLDVYKTVGKATALDRTYAATVSNGLLTISFAQVGGNYKPMVSAIEMMAGGSAPTPTVPPTATATPTLTPSPTATFSLADLPLRIDSGSSGAYTDSLGQIWRADQKYDSRRSPTWGWLDGSPGSVASGDDPFTDARLYQTWRAGGNLKYQVDVPAGVYRATLRFAEFEVYKAGERKMQIAIEGQQVESLLDIYALVGVGQPLDRVYTATVTDGQLNIVFDDTSPKPALVSAVAVEWLGPVPTPTPTVTATPTSTPTRTPTATATSSTYTRRVNAGGVTYTDTQAQVWSADQSYVTGGWGYVSGNAKSSNSAVTPTNDDLLYQKYREGMSAYRFTLPNGTYQVMLRFAEFATSTVGQRVMRITMEGADVETALDVVKTVGRTVNLDKTYTVTISDGVLDVTFAQVGGRYKPMVSAIEVR